jgi:cytochrome c
MNLMPSLLVAVLSGLLLPAQAATGDAEQGHTLYQARCAACHALDYNGVGPAHRGLWGRMAAQAPGYAYSDALRAARQVWNQETLDRWLADPESFAPGQRMGVNVPDAQERAHLIAYLKAASAAAR